jgi:23S rRNA (cytosine1962-C5)-methyltransferase
MSWPSDRDQDRKDSPYGKSPRRGNSPYRGRDDRDNRGRGNREGYNRGHDSRDEDHRQRGHLGKGHYRNDPRGGGHYRRQQREQRGEQVERLEPWVALRGPMRGPRVWSGDVDQCSGRFPAGELVAVYDQYNDFRGWGFWHPRSRIAVRVVTRETTKPDTAWWQDRARAAAQRRLQNPEIPNEVCRILHAEGDDFPALTLDRYGDVLIGEVYSKPMADIFQEVLPTFHEVLGTSEYRLSFDEASARAEGEDAFEKSSAGCPPRLQFQEGGITFEAFLAEGHKSGFFCDQRENRARLSALVQRLVAEGNPPTVLDVCCYTGGFALNAAAAGAGEVRGVDLDEKAIEQAKRNANLNQLRNVKFTHADAFSYLRTLAGNDRQYDIVVVDPPKFIRTRRDFDEGQARYHDINKLAMPLVKPGGFLISCSCSGLFGPLEFQETMRRAARLRTVRILRETGAGPDHPVRIDFPEGRYLKSLWMQLD